MNWRKIFSEEVRFKGTNAKIMQAYDVHRMRSPKRRFNGYKFAVIVDCSLRLAGEPVMELDVSRVRFKRIQSRTRVMKDLTGSYFWHRFTMQFRRK